MAPFFDVTFRLPYKKFPLLDGGESFSAVANVNLALPIKNAPRSKRFEAIIDSGPSRCMFHGSIGRAIGLEIEKGQPEDTTGINGPSVNYFHSVNLYAPGGVLAIRAGFSDDLPIAGLLGMNGFFDHFKIIFNHESLHCELELLFPS